MAVIHTAWLHHVLFDAVYSCVYNDDAIRLIADKTTLQRARPLSHFPIHTVPALLYGGYSSHQLIHTSSTAILNLLFVLAADTGHEKIH